MMSNLAPTGLYKRHGLRRALGLGRNALLSCASQSLRPAACRC